MIRSVVIGVLVISVAAVPASAFGLNRFIREMNKAAEEEAAARDQEMRELIGPNYEAGPEKMISPSSREAAANIHPGSLKQTRYNGLLAELVGTDRDLGTPQTAAVGDVIFAEFSYFVRPGYRMAQPFSWSPVPAEKYDVPLITTIKPDTYGLGICTAERMASLDGKPKKRVCFRDTDLDLKFDTVTGIVRFEDRRPLATPLPYRIVATMIVASRFRRELVYLGRAGDTLRFQYREYQTNLIRPAFTSEMTYTVEPSGPTQIRYQTMKLEIQSISNDGIRYVIR